MTARFSKKYQSFAQWEKSHKADNPFNRRIKNLHKKHPDWDLSHLRGHKVVPKVYHVVVAGNVVSQNRTETAAGVYIEVVTKSQRKEFEEFFAKKIEKRLDEEGLNIYSDYETIIVSFMDEEFVYLHKYGRKILSQQKAIQKIIDTLKEDLHPAVKRSHHGPNEPTTGHHDYLKNRKAKNKNKLAYDNNEGIE